MHINVLIYKRKFLIHDGRCHPCIVYHAGITKNEIIYEIEGNLKKLSWEIMVDPTTL